MTPRWCLPCRQDAIAPMDVGEFVARQIPDARLVVLDDWPCGLLALD